MAGFRIEGNTSGNVAEVDANNNFKTTLPTTKAQAGFACMAVENDDGAVIGARYVKRLYTTETGRLAIGVDQTLFNEYFPGTALNSALWQAPVTTMTVAVAAGFCTLNNGSSLASAAVAQVRSYRHFPAYMGYPTRLEMDLQFPFVPVTNNVSEWGWFLASGTTAPTDGIFFRLNATGEFRCVLNFNGTENQSAALDFATLVGANTTKMFLIEIVDEEVHFYIGSQVVAEIPLPSAGGSPTMSMNLPVTFRTYNSAATASAQQIKIGAVNVSLCDMNAPKAWGHILTGAGGHSSQGQTGGTMGSTANFANSANPTAAVPTNTTAALGTGLGGQFWETDTLAVTTDGIISSYQCPLGTAALPGKTLYITRIGISSFVQTALTGGPYVAVWSVAYGHTAVSLATAEAATTKAPRRIPLSYTQAVTSGQAIGTKVGVDFEADFDSAPIVVQPGEFIQLVKKKVGTAPTAGVIAHIIRISGYWE